MNRPDGGVIVSGAGLDIRERGVDGLVQVAVWPGAEAAAAMALQRVAITLPAVPGQVGEDAGGTAMAIAPGRWLVEFAGGSLPDLPAAVGAVTDLAHGRRSFLVSGRQALALVAKLAPVDFDLPRHGPGSVVQTGSAHGIPFSLWRRDAASFVLHVETSLAHDFALSLAAEAEEFLGGGAHG